VNNGNTGGGRTANPNLRGTAVKDGNTGWGNCDLRRAADTAVDLEPYVNTGGGNCDLRRAADTAVDLEPHVNTGGGNCDLRRAADTAVDLEPYRVPLSRWRTIRRSSYFRTKPEHRLPPLDGVSNTLRSSYAEFLVRE